MKNKIKVTIHRKKWLRGGRKDNAEMRNDAGSQCCLGFVARKCGIAVADLVGVGEPEGVACNIINDGRKIPEEFLPLLRYDTHYKDYANSKITSKLIDINDDPELSPTERENKIKKELAKLNFNVTFED